MTLVRCGNPACGTRFDAERAASRDGFCAECLKYARTGTTAARVGCSAPAGRADAGRTGWLLVASRSAQVAPDDECALIGERHVSRVEAKVASPRLAGSVEPPDDDVR